MNVSPLAVAYLRLARFVWRYRRDTIRFEITAIREGSELQDYRRLSQRAFYQYMRIVFDRQLAAAAAGGQSTPPPPDLDAAWRDLQRRAGGA